MIRDSRRKSQPVLDIRYDSLDKTACRLVNGKVEACKRTGIRPRRTSFCYTSVTALAQSIAASDADGIYLQRPMPFDFDANDRYVVGNAIGSGRDVDGFYYPELFMPCAAYGTYRLLTSLKPRSEWAGTDAVVIGRAKPVGLDVLHMLIDLDMSVSVCHSKTKDLGEYVRRASVVVSATGVPGLVTPEMVREDGALFVDIGSTVQTTAVRGDVHALVAKHPNAYVTSTLHGMNRLIDASLMYNTALTRA